MEIQNSGQGRISRGEVEAIEGDLVVLYPPDGSRLDPSEVEGLLPAAA
jgi:hypothetical protein